MPPLSASAGGIDTMRRSKRRLLGQNFLVDPRVAARIVELAAEHPKNVLEIGPGRGALTDPLLERFDRVVGLELDRELVEELAQRFGDRGFEVRHGDALNEPLEPLLGDDLPWQLAANLPYSVGTAIVRRLLPRHDLFSRMVVMLQSEVVDRLVARPGDPGHGLMALECSAWAEARVALTVPPTAFRPRPKVVSAVVVLDLHPPVHDSETLARALSLASHGLTRPRKMLPNALRPRVSLEHLTVAGLDPRRRPGTLTLEDWVALAGVVPCGV
jgi:16S rRNA (adenine1518-N6/adenine1519-N6)-dimethyltransferase